MIKITFFDPFFAHFRAKKTCEKIMIFAVFTKPTAKTTLNMVDMSHIKAEKSWKIDKKGKKYVKMDSFFIHITWSRFFFVMSFFGQFESLSLLLFLLIYERKGKKKGKKYDFFCSFCKFFLLKFRQDYVFIKKWQNLCAARRASPCT